MSRNEPDASTPGPPEQRSNEVDSAEWVIGSGATDCEHPGEAITRLGGDGLNGYYRCGRCETVIVVQDEVGDVV